MNTVYENYVNKQYNIDLRLKYSSLNNIKADSDSKCFNIITVNEKY